VKARPAIVYSVLRLLAFLVPFGLMMLVPILREFYWLSAIFAALIGLSLSIIFLNKPLNEATAGLGAKQRAPRTSAGAADAASEDAVLDAAAPAASAAPAATAEAAAPAATAEAAGPAEAHSPSATESEADEQR